MKKRFISINNKELYCLFSVDITNSTKNKYETQQWDNIVFSFYEKIPLHFQNKLKEKGSENTIEIWKYVGDEILFYSKITDIKQIPLVVIAFKETLEFFSRNGQTTVIKGTVWTAQTNIIDKSFYPNKNNLNNITTLDFIGPSVDCGFRISKYSSKEYIAISVEIADLCKDNSILNNSIYYQNSELLKGVNHNDRKYPIFLLKLDIPDLTIENTYLRNPCDIESLYRFLNEYYTDSILSKFNWCISRITNDYFSKFENKTIFRNSRGSNLIEENNSNNIQKIKDWFYETFEDPSYNCNYNTERGDFIFSSSNNTDGYDCAEEINNKFCNIYSIEERNTAINEILTESCCYRWNKK